jgi:hypothetical protein
MPVTTVMGSERVGSFGGRNHHMCSAFAERLSSLLIATSTHISSDGRVQRLEAFMSDLQVVMLLVSALLLNGDHIGSP